VGSFLWWKLPSLAPQENEVRPLFFGTDTIFGLKVAWDGTTSEIPDTVKLGFHRKEVAIAPVNGRMGCTVPVAKDGFEVWMAPFLSWIDVNVNTGKPSDTKFGYAQGFATGIAANNWAAIPKVKNLVLEYANPKLAEAVSFNTDTAASPLRKRIDIWLRAAPSNRVSFKQWFSDEKYASNETGAEVSWLYSAPVEQLQKAIDKFTIS